MAIVKEIPRMKKSNKAITDEEIGLERAKAEIYRQRKKVAKNCHGMIVLDARYFDTLVTLSEIRYNVGHHTARSITHCQKEVVSHRKINNQRMDSTKSRGKQLRYALKAIKLAIKRVSASRGQKISTGRAAGALKRNEQYSCNIPNMYNLSTNKLGE